MNFLSIFLFSLCSNIDNFILGVSYGVKEIHIPIVSNIFIALITFAGTIVSMSIGNRVALFISPIYASVFGGSILILIGTVGVVKFLIGTTNSSSKRDNSEWPIGNPEKYDESNNKNIELRESILLGIALSANNLGLGIGASFSKIAVLPAAIGSLILSVVLLSLGNLFGNTCFFKQLGKYAEIASAGLIVILGLYSIIF